MSVPLAIDEPATQYVIQPLFGGAMQIALPPRLDDVAALRQVPDNQEVFVDAAADRCIIVELLAFDASLTTAAAAAAHYWSDLATTNGVPEDDATSSLADAPIDVPPDEAPLIADVAAARVVVRGLMRVAKFRERAANDVVVHLAVLRCPAIATDILVSQTFPRHVDAASSSARSVDSALLSETVAAADFAALLASIRINDMSLFV